MGATTDARRLDAPVDDRGPGSAAEHRPAVLIPTLLATAGGLAVLLWSLTRPALWLDESASVVATQRTWPNLWHLFGGPDAPLVPFYTVLKPVTAGLRQLGPGLADSPELLFRLPSVAAAVAAVTLLTLWSARRAGIAVALPAAAVLITAVGFSRYGQEARPYASAMLVAVVATVAHDRLLKYRGWPRALAYALSVALLASAHLLAVTLVAAHLLTAGWLAAGRRDLDDPSRDDAARPRRSRTGTVVAAVVPTLFAAAAGLILAVPLLLPAILNGTGPLRTMPVTGERLWSAFASLFIGENRSMSAGLAVVLVLAATGLGRAVRDRQASLARAAAGWALVPPAVLLPVVLARPNLLMPRYLLFVLPGWALLAGCGLATLATAAAAALRRVGDRPGRGIARVVAALAALAALALPAVGQLNALRAVRTPLAHTDDDIRPALAAADRPEYATLPVMVTAPTSALQVAAYSRRDERRLVGPLVQRDLSTPWSVDRRDWRPALEDHPRLVLLMRVSRSNPCRTSGIPQKYVRACMPKVLRQMHYQPEAAQIYPGRWAFAVVSR